MGEFRKKLKIITTKEYTREEIINFLLHLTIILVPLMITNSNWPYIDGKVIVLYVIGAFTLIFGFKDIIVPSLKENKIALIFLITILIPCIMSPEKRTAFIGSNNRGEGFIMITIYVILFILSIKYLKINSKGANIIFAVACIISIYGVIEFYGIDPIQQVIFGEVQLDAGSISTIGNRNFLSNYLCIFVFLSSGMYIFNKGKKYLPFAGILFSGLLCTLTRSGWLAFIVFSIIGLFFIIKRKDCLKRAVVIFIVFTIIFGLLNLTTNNAVILRGDTDQIISEDGKLVGTPNERAEILRICWNAFKDSPFKGYGPDTLKIRLQEEYPKDSYIYMIQHGVFIDKAHNEYVEYAVSSGILTLISYLILIGVIIKGLVKGIKNDLNKILLLTLIGYLVQAFFNISTIAVAPLYWIFLGYCVNTIHGKNQYNTKTVI